MHDVFLCSVWEFQSLNSLILLLSPGRPAEADCPTVGPCMLPGVPSLMHQHPQLWRGKLPSVLRPLHGGALAAGSRLGAAAARWDGLARAGPEQHSEKPPSLTMSQLLGSLVLSLSNNPYPWYKLLAPGWKQLFHQDPPPTWDVRSQASGENFGLC